MRIRAFLLLGNRAYEMRAAEDKHDWVIGHFVCFLMPMELVFIELHWHLFFLR